MKFKSPSSVNRWLCKCGKMHEQQLFIGDRRMISVPESCPNEQDK
jgi:hypothetical protein